MRKIVLTLLLAALVVPAAAQNRNNSRSRVKIEWGAIAGINISDFNSKTPAVEVTNKLGWQAGIVTAINFGAYAIEPQVLYVRNGLTVKTTGDKELKLKSNSIDVPILLSLRFLKPLRIYAGPVFNLMNDCKQKSGNDLIDFGRVRPTMNYTAGVGIALGNSLIDLRYNGQFKAKEDVVLPNGMVIDNLSSFNFALSFGYVF